MVLDLRLTKKVEVVVMTTFSRFIPLALYFPFQFILKKEADICIRKSKALIFHA